MPAVLEVGDYATGKLLIDKGLFEQLDLKYFPLDAYPSLSANKDYLLDALPFATVLVYNTEVYPDAGPAGPLDFFDLEKFPGKRCAYDWPQWLLEWATMANGVPAEQVYDVLSQPDGVQAAFDRLDTIKDDLILYTSAAEGIQFLLDGQCDMAETFNGRPAARVKEEPDLPIQIVWEGAWVNQDSFGIPKGAQNYRAALSAFAYLSTPQNQCDMINEITYGVALNAPPFPECLTEFANTWSWAGKEGTVDATLGDQFWLENLDAVVEEWSTWKVE
jgi:putative spermidine/putrescine transport system substrate-binding protein